MNSDFSYLASKCFNLTSKNRSKSCTCPSISLSVQYLMQNHNWIDFGHFFHFFCKFPKRHIKKRMTTCKIILTPTTKEPKICHALATTSAFNLKLCHITTLTYLDSSWLREFPTIKRLSLNFWKPPWQPHPPPSTPPNTPPSYLSLKVLYLAPRIFPENCPNIFF